VKPIELYCEICFEEGKLRSCCKSVYCDYDYTKNKSCPKCNNDTKKDKISGAVFVVSKYSEFEECRICLGAGLKRRCCGNYYCDDCYYQFPNCRSCNKPTSNRGLNSQFKNKASVVTVLMGYTLSIFLIFCTLAVLVILIVNETGTNVGLFGYKCYGFFKTCDTYVCRDVDHDVVTNSYEALDDLSSWQKCGFNSTAKLQAQACVYDEELFALSAEYLGFDVCEDEFAEGIYVFEDTFEYWQSPRDYTSNLMKSAIWNETANVETANHCGTPSGGGANAMVFGGEFFRYAITNDVDLKFGGWIEADVFMAPVGYDVSHEFCKTVYTGHVRVDFSLDHGNEWENLAFYEAWRYTSASYFHIELEIPEYARSTEIRFRFAQNVFEAARDHWALDNVKIFHRFETNWKSDATYVENLAIAKDPIQLAQCCFDTDWCETRLSEDELEQCKTVPNYTQTTYYLRGIELYIMIGSFLTVVKFIYMSVQDWVQRKRLPFNDELDHFNFLDKLVHFLPPHYRPKHSLVNKFVDIHKGARMDASMKNAMEGEEEKESEEDAARRKADTEKMQRLILANKKKREKQEKKLLKHFNKRKKIKEMKGKPEPKEAWIAADEVAPDVVVPGFDVVPFDENEDYDSLAPLDINHEMDMDSSMDKSIPNNEDLEKRADLSLRMAVELADSWTWRRGFTVFLCSVYLAAFLYKSTTQENYTLIQPVLVVDRYKGIIEFEAGGILFFALFLDFKEIYHVLWKVVPCSDSLIPYVTLDTTFDVNSLFIGNDRINLEDVKEAHTFSIYFLISLIFGYSLGCMPWCLISMLVRDLYLPFDIMRMVTPMLGSIIVARAVLGPALFIKSALGLYAVLDLSLKGREDLGLAFKAKKSRMAAINMALGFSCIGSLLLCIVWTDMAGIAFPVLFGFGFFYGAMTGCSHELTLKPWMLITTITDGVWLKVKQQKRCPCVYWGGYCTDMHDTNEMFIIFPKDPVLFLGKLKGSVDDANS